MTSVRDPFADAGFLANLNIYILGRCGHMGDIQIYSLVVWFSKRDTRIDPTPSPQSFATGRFGSFSPPSRIQSISHFSAIAHRRPPASDAVRGCRDLRLLPRPTCAPCHPPFAAAMRLPPPLGREGNFAVHRVNLNF